MKLNFGAMKNPVMETFVAEYKRGNKVLGEIIFKLRPINTDLALMVSQLGQVGVMDYDRLRYRIASNRITEWQNVYDEKGEEVEFTMQAFGQFLDMPDSIPFIDAVCDKTIQDVQMLSVMTKPEGEEPAGKKAKPAKENPSDNS